MRIMRVAACGLLFLFASLAGAQSSTPKGLNKPAYGSPRWDRVMNENWDKVDELLDTKVGTTGDETIEGKKTFSSSPAVPTPSADTDVANKSYVDNKQPNLTAPGPIGSTTPSTGSFTTLTASASITSPQHCIGTDCLTAWPSGSLPSGVASDGDQGLTIANKLSAGSLGSFPSFLEVDKRALRQVADSTALGTGTGNSNLTLGQRYNLATYTETGSNKSTTSATVNSSDTIVWNGITLFRVTGANFYASMYTNLGGTGVSLTTGTQYLFSAYILNNYPIEQLLVVGTLLSDGNNNYNRRFVDKNVRRIWFTCVALSSSTVDCGTLTPTTALGSGPNTGEIWIMQGSTNGASVLMEYASLTPTLDVYIGGMQIEPIYTEKQGIAAIGDSKTQFSCGTTDLNSCDSWTIWAAGLLNVPIFNRAIGGQKCSDMDARWSTDMTPLAVRAKYALVTCGVNDIATGRALSDIQASINSMATKATADGYLFVIATAGPTSSIGANSTYEATRQSLNQWIKQNFPRVLDYAALTEDPYDPTSIRRVNGWFPPDGVHEMWRARRAFGEYVALSYVGNPYGYPQIWDFQRPKPYQPVPVTTATLSGTVNARVLQVNGADVLASFYKTDQGTPQLIKTGSSGANVAGFVSVAAVDNYTGSAVFYRWTGSAYTWAVERIYEDGANTLHIQSCANVTGDSNGPPNTTPASCTDRLSIESSGKTTAAYLNASSGFQANGTAGYTGTVNTKKNDGTTNCALTVVTGIITASTCN